MRFKIMQASSCFPFYNTKYLLLDKFIVSLLIDFPIGASEIYSLIRFEILQQGLALLQGTLFMVLSCCYRIYANFVLCRLLNIDQMVTRNLDKTERI